MGAESARAPMLAGLSHSLVTQPHTLAHVSQKLQVWKSWALASQIACWVLRQDQCEVGEKPLWLKQVAGTRLPAAPRVLPEFPTSVASSQDQGGGRSL